MSEREFQTNARAVEGPRADRATEVQREFQTNARAVEGSNRGNESEPERVSEERLCGWSS